MEMKAAVMHGPNDIRVEAVEKPECPVDGLILKVMAVGLCGSDIRNLTSDSRKGKYPFIYGHEIVGVVDEIGAEESKYQVGDRLYERDVEIFIFRKINLKGIVDFFYVDGSHFNI